MQKLLAATIVLAVALLAAAPMHGAVARSDALHRLTLADSGSTVQAAVGDLVVADLVAGSGYSWTSATSSNPMVGTALTTGGSDLGNEVGWDIVGTGTATIEAIGAPGGRAGVAGASVHFTATIVVNGPGQAGPAASAGATVSAGPRVSYPAGYSLVGAPSGTTLPVDAYRLDPSSGNYIRVTAGTPLTAGVGYLAYFSSAASVPLASPGSAAAQVTLPGGSYALLGNPSATSPAAIAGADLVQVFNAALQVYLPQLEPVPPGGAALVYVSHDATVTISAAAP